MPIQKIRDMAAFITPVRVISRPDRLVIQDHRPTVLQLCAMGGAVFFAVAFLSQLLPGVNSRVDSFALWSTGTLTLILAGFSMRGTLREEYIFDKSNDSYAFIRRSLHRREVIEGALSQFTGAFVRTYTNDDSESYGVVLKQQGLLLGGEQEQQLRENFPVLNSYGREERIARAINDLLGAKHIDIDMY